MDKSYMILEAPASVTEQLMFFKPDWSKMPIFRTEEEAAKWIEDNGKQYETYVIVPCYCKY